VVRSRPRLREKITLHDIGIWSHYVGDASQPLHVSVHLNGWGNFPNPNGYSDSKSPRLLRGRVREEEPVTPGGRG